MYFELPNQGLIRFSGEDARVFLHNQLTCDVEALGIKQGTYGAYCTPKGRVLATFLLWHTEQGYFMQLPSSLREPIRKQLTKFILRSKVKAEDASTEWSLHGISGSDAGTIVERAVGSVPRGTHEIASSTNVMAIRLSGERYLIAGAEAHKEKLNEALSRGRKGELEHWDWLKVRAGIPTILPVTQEEFVPQMVNLDLIGGVSFEKGCYPGQEIVARMHYRGTLKQRMYLANVPGPDRPQPGEKLYSPTFGEQACGTIVNAARSPDGGHDALAVIQIASTETGNVHWNTQKGPALKLLPLPYNVTSA